MVEKARQALSEFMELSRKSQRQISKETGLSSSVISQFLKGGYTGDNEEVAKTVNQYLTMGKERLNSVSSSCFYPELQNTKEVLFACFYAHRNNDITLVSGDAGAGKTTALKHYAESNTGVIFVTANACTTSASAVLGLICQKVGRQLPVRKAAMMNTLVEVLSGTNRLIIIDEADHLSLDALQAVRNLNDLAEVGIVLSGNDKIYLQMKSGRRSYEFDQLRTRIIVRRRVHNEYTVPEMEAMFPNLNQDCIGYMLKVAGEESLRTVKKLYNIAQEFAAAKGQQLNIKHLRDTKKQF
jgi:DNA transposition AAA+ family ATPase